MPSDEVPSDGQKLWLRQCLLLCKKYNIECNAYGTSNDWLTNNKKRRIKVELKSLFGLEKREDRTWKYMDRGITKDKYLKGNKFKRVTRVSDAVLLYNIDDYNQLTESAKTFADRIVRDSFNDQFSVLQADVHNMRSNEPKDRQPLDDLVVSPFNLRKKLNLADGSHVDVETV